MFGVLRGVDSAANQVRLRAISGVFTLLGVNSARPNTYWSPGLNPTHTIHSATRGSRVYPLAPAANPVGGTFGSCAASKLLTHALHLGLSINSMAEMWVGAPQGVRTDGQLQASCDNCRRYLGEMLCEYGPLARSDAYPAGGVVPDPNGMPPNFGFRRTKEIQIWRMPMTPRSSRNRVYPHLAARGAGRNSSLYETELADLEILARTRFSGIHRAFLRRFGNSVGGLDFGPVDPTAPALREVFEATTGSLPPGYELFAVSREDPYLDVFLVGQEPDELQIGTSYSVFGGDFGDLDVAGLTVVSGSLTELLCYIPYVHTRYEPKPMKFMLSNRSPCQAPCRSSTRSSRTTA